MKRKIEQVENVCTVVCTFRGVPGAVSVYPNERDALKAYKSKIEIHDGVAEKQAGHKVDRKEFMNGKSRVKTSCSGLPRCVFDDGFGVAVVRGPRYDVRESDPDSIPFIAVNRDDGSLSVTCFKDKKAAEGVYNTIRMSHIDGGDFMEFNDDILNMKSFSTDEISVAVGSADIVEEGEECRVV